MLFISDNILKLFNIYNGTIVAILNKKDMQGNVGRKHGAQIPMENQLGRIDRPVCWGMVVHVPPQAKRLFSL